MILILRQTIQYRIPETNFQGFKQNKYIHILIEFIGKEKLKKKLGFKAK